MRWAVSAAASLEPSTRREFRSLQASLQEFLQPIFTPEGEIKIGRWTDFPPFWSTDGTGDEQPAIGSGEIRGQYSHLGSTVWINIQLRLAADSDPGVGLWRFGLPSINRQAIRANPSVGVWWGEVVDGPSYLGGQVIVTDHGCVLFGASSGPVDAATPITWAAGDRIHLSIAINLDARASFVIVQAPPEVPPDPEPDPDPPDPPPPDPEPEPDPDPPPDPDYSFSFSGAQGVGTWDLLEDGPFVLSDPGSTSLIFAQPDGWWFSVRGVAAGGTGGSASHVVVPPLGFGFSSGGGGGSGARLLSGHPVQVTEAGMTAHVGHASGTRATILQLASGAVKLNLGGGGDGSEAGPGGSGGLVIVGPGGSHGSSGQPGDISTGIEAVPVAGGTGANGVDLSPLTFRGWGGNGADTPVSEGTAPGSPGTHGGLIISLLT